MLIETVFRRVPHKQFLLILFLLASATGRADTGEGANDKTASVTKNTATPEATKTPAATPQKAPQQSDAPMEAEIIARSQLDAAANHIRDTVLEHCQHDQTHKWTIYIIDVPPQIARTIIQSQELLITNLNNRADDILKGQSNAAEVRAQPPTSQDGSSLVKITGDLTGIGTALSAVSSIFSTGYNLVQYITPKYSTTAFTIAIDNKTFMAALAAQISTDKRFDPPRMKMMCPALFGYDLTDSKFWKDLTDLDSKAAAVATKPGKMSEKWLTDYTNYIQWLNGIPSQTKNPSDVKDPNAAKDSNAPTQSTPPGTQIATIFEAIEAGGQVSKDPDSETLFVYINFDHAGGAVETKEAFLAKSQNSYSTGLEITYFVTDNTGAIITAGDPKWYSGPIKAPTPSPNPAAPPRGGSKPTQ
jgi:hypothetical protein